MEKEQLVHNVLLLSLGTMEWRNGSALGYGGDQEDREKCMGLSTVRFCCVGLGDVLLETWYGRLACFLLGWQALLLCS